MRVKQKPADQEQVLPADPGCQDRRRSGHCDLRLAAAGFIEGGAATQPESVITMLNVMYLWLPAIFCALVTFLLTKLNVEKANKKLLAEKVN